MKIVSIVILIYNEESTIVELWNRLYKTIQTIPYKFEIIFVNDASIDESRKILEDLIYLHPNIIRIIDFSRNFGHPQALTAGMNHSSGDCIILMDGDLQDSPESISKFIDKWENGYDVVYAIREKRKEFFIKRILFKLFYKIQALIVNIDIPVDAGIFSLMDRKVVNIILEMKENNKYIPGLRAYTGFKQVGLEIEREKRYYGKTRVGNTRLIKLALDGIFTFSNVPLKFATYIGIILAFPSLVLSIIVVLIKIFSDNATPGWASNLATTFFIGGIQLIFLGIIGEYLSRIYEEVKRRPYYIISKKTGFEK